MSEELRIVLLGKTGVGKSASGNTILGTKVFKSKITPTSVTAVCEKKHAIRDGRDMYIIDTPGLFDTGYDNATIIREIVKCISLSSPGPHAFVVVIQLGRFTQEEHATVKMIQEIFGKESAKFTIVLFSHGDRLEDTTIEEFIGHSKDLAEFTAQCKGGYHVFNNQNPDQNPKNCSQVTELLTKIDKMVSLNGGGHYTTEMYKQAEEAIEKEKARILKENKQLLEAEARRQAELDNDFIRECAKECAKVGAVGCGVGGGVGGALVAGFALGGPAGALIGLLAGVAGGAVVGGAGGAAVGATSGAIKKGKCTIQ